MARARIPAAKAVATGASLKNPKRHAGRKARRGDQLGPPGAWLDEWGVRAFEDFKRELPWLKAQHRLVVEMASDLRGALMNPGAGLSLAGRQELRRLLAQLGATPADESKVSLGDGEDEDPDEAFFGKAN